jgi:putative methyltransferase (TIGR04325 family)
MKRFLSLLIPPLILRFIRLTLDFRIKISSNKRVTDYSDEVLTSNVIAKTIRMKGLIAEQDYLTMESYRIAFAVLSCKVHPKNVLDLGGGAGYQFFNLRKITQREYCWSIIETMELVKQAKMNKELTEIKFYNSIAEFQNTEPEEVDLLFCSRALQYFPDPEYVCRQIVALNPRNIFFSGLTLSPDSDFHALTQDSMLSSNGPGPLPEGVKDIPVSYPYQLIPLESILKIFSINYELLYQTVEEAVVHTYKNRAISYQGLFLVRKK